MIDAIDGLAIFLDSACGRMGVDSFATSPRLLAAMKVYKLKLESQGLSGTRGPARRPTVHLLRALESFVVDGKADAYDRSLAWYRLLCTWGVTRFDDHRGMQPAQVRVAEDGLEAILCRTKTTGIGRAVQERTVRICNDAYLHDQGWLRAGYQEWMKLGLHGRDYALLLPR